MRNGLNAVLNDDYGGRSFTTVMGATARLEITTMVSSRFNMHGRDVGGRKVGLLEKYQLWVYLVDPFKHHLPFQIAIEGDGGMDGKFLRMVSFFVKKKA